MAFELTPWRPFRELATVRDEMDSLWERFLGEWPVLEPFRREWTPSLDVSEMKDSIVVKAEIPGIDPKDIDISLTGAALTIKGEKKQEKEQKDENYHRVERSNEPSQGLFGYLRKSKVIRSRAAIRTVCSRSPCPSQKKPRRRKSRSRWNNLCVQS
jgi:HSP20 family molecular chaperone IbpA